MSLTLLISVVTLWSRVMSSATIESQSAPFPTMHRESPTQPMWQTCLPAPEMSTEFWTILLLESTEVILVEHFDKP